MIVSAQENSPVNSSVLEDYIELLKPRVMSLAIFTSFIGMMVAPGHLHPYLIFVAMVCISVGAGGAGCLNMWWEMKTDGLMKRTQNRPLPSGRIDPESALVLGIMLSFGSVIILGLAVNMAAALWLLFTILFYVVVYTIYLKPRTDQNIVIGGLSGAMPPVIGYTCVTGFAGLESWLLCAIIFFWTPPHFWALCINHADDYQKAGFPMTPNTLGLHQTKLEIAVYTTLTVGVSLFLWFLNYAHFIYGGGAFLLGAWFIITAYKLYQDSLTPMKFFVHSIFYLFGIFLLRLIDWIILG